MLIQHTTQCIFHYSIVTLNNAYISPVSYHSRKLLSVVSLTKFHSFLICLRLLKPGPSGCFKRTVLDNDETADHAACDRARCQNTADTGPQTIFLAVTYPMLNEHEVRVHRHTKADSEGDMARVDKRERKGNSYARLCFRLSDR